ncbi:MAG TPA: TraR/DksA family transcriptional regulator [Thermodesulfovibrionales bacterium]|nr:TraR/DksA family transcriptional regulator [Thermodesulfovibrionales bacterium]
MAEKKAKKPVTKETAKKKATPAAKKTKVSPPAKRVKEAGPLSKPKASASAKHVQKKESEEERNLRLKRLLVEKRKEVLREIKNDTSRYIKGESKQLVDTALDDGDWSIVDLAEDINLQHLGAHREDLLKIDEAIRKLAEGTYGICEDCGDEISEQRLKILPYAICCIDCKEKRERMEEIQRREGLL